MTTAIPIAQYLAELPVTRLPGETMPTRAVRAPRLTSIRPETDPALEADRAYRRGLEDGRAAARAEYAKHLDDLRREFDEQRLGDRQAWADGEARRMAEALDNGLAQIEAHIAETVARVLEPFLLQERRRRAVQELVEAINAMVLRQQALEVAIRGPEDLVQALHAALDGRVRLECAISDEPDVQVLVDHTIIETRIGAWMSRVAGGGHG
jgi:hypothetical protein